MGNELSFFSDSSSVVKMGVDQILLATIVVIVLLSLFIIYRHINKINIRIKEIEDLYQEIELSMSRLVSYINNSLCLIDIEYETKTEKLEGILHSREEIKTKISDISSISNAAYDETKISIDGNIKNAYKELSNIDKLIDRFSEINRELFLADQSPYKRLALNLTEKKAIGVYNKYKDLKKIYNS